MEVLENNRSKMTERVTLTSLLQFIKDNTQQFQPKEEIIKEKIEKIKEKIKDTNNTNEVAIKKKSTEDTKPNKKFKGCENVYISRSNNFTFLDNILFFLNDKSITSELIISGLKRFIQYGGFTDFGYSKLKWNKKMITNSIDTNTIDEYYIRSLSDYLHVNIFILNEDSEAFTLYGDFYPNRKIYVIYNHNQIFYPVFDKDTIFFNQSSEFIAKYLPKDKESKLDSIDIYGPLKIPEFLPEIQIDEAIIPQADLHSVVNGFDDYDSDEDDENANENEQNEDEDKNKNENANNHKDYSKLSYKELQILAKKLLIDIKENGKLLTKEKLCIKIKEKQ